MWSAVVVPAKEACQGSGSVLAGGVGEAVGPLAEQRFDQRLRLAVRPRRVAAGVAAPDPELGAGVAPAVGVVALRVVGEDALDADAAVAVPCDGTGEEGGASVAV